MPTTKYDLSLYTRDPYVYIGFNHMESSEDEEKKLKASNGENTFIGRKRKSVNEKKKRKQKNDEEKFKSTHSVEYRFKITFEVRSFLFNILEILRSLQGIP